MQLDLFQRKKKKKKERKRQNRKTVTDVKYIFYQKNWERLEKERERFQKMYFLHSFQYFH